MKLASKLKNPFQGAAAAKNLAGKLKKPFQGAAAAAKNFAGKSKKRLQAATLGVLSLFGPAAINDTAYGQQSFQNPAYGQQSFQNPAYGQQSFFNPGGEIYGRRIPYYAGPGGAAGTNIALGYWAPLYQQQMGNPPRAYIPPVTYNNQYNRFQGQTFSVPSNRTNSGYGSNSGYNSNQVDSRYIEEQRRAEIEKQEKQEKHKAILEQIKYAKTSPDGTFKYVLNINKSKFHLIIPISKDFELPDMKEMYRVKFGDPFKAGTPYYYLVTDGSVETSYKQQKSPTAPSATTACRQTISCLREVICCPCK